MREISLYKAKCFETVSLSHVTLFCKFIFKLIEIKKKKITFDLSFDQIVNFLRTVNKCFVLGFNCIPIYFEPYGYRTRPN